MSRKIVNPLCPYTHRRLLFSIRSLCERYRGLICTVCEGKSEQGRSIPVISSGKGEKRILAVGAIHGREYVSTNFLLMCIEEYAESYCKNEQYKGFDVKKILSEYTFHFVPVANPDSVEIALGRALPCCKPQDFSSVLFKNNSNNVNLNANFPFMWESVPFYRQGGSKAASERETRFLIHLCEKYPYESMLSFHSRGDCLYWRDEGNAEIKGDRELAEKLRYTCGFALCPSTKDKADYSGGFENWFRYRFSKPGICVELIKDENAPFSLCCRDFYSLTRWEETGCAVLCATDI